MNSDPLLLIQGRQKVFIARIQATGAPHFGNYFEVIKYTSPTLQNYVAFKLTHFSSSLLWKHIITNINSLSQTIHFEIFTVGINSTIKIQMYVARAVALLYLHTTVYVINTIIKNISLAYHFRHNTKYFSFYTYY
jgi:hypothetical protein